MPKKLVIRINNLQEKEQENEENYNRFVVTTVHWNRIIAAIIALLVAVGLVLWVVFSLLGNNNGDQTELPAIASTGSESELFKSETSSAADLAATKLPVAGDEDIFLQPLTEASQVDAPPATTKAAAESLQSVSPAESPAGHGMHPDTIAVASAEQLVSEVVLAVVEDVPQGAGNGRLQAEGATRSEDSIGLQAIDEVDAAAIREMAASEVPAATGPEKPAPVEVTADSAPPRSLAEEAAIQEAAAKVVEQQAAAPEISRREFSEQPIAEVSQQPGSTAEPRAFTRLRVNPVRSSGPPAQVIIHSSRIKNAQLTTWVAQQQPRDQLGSVAYLAGDELLRIFLFTEMSGLKGRTLYHDWYLNDKPMAQVRVPVREDELAASSSKFIDQYMLGSWKVIVTDDSGKRYITADFEVKAG